MDQKSIAAEVSRVANATYGHSRRIMPEQPWWNNLDPVFHKFPDDFYLDTRTQVVVESLAMLDVITRTGFASLATLFAIISTIRKLKADNAERHFYTALADRGDVDAVFPRPTASINVTRTPVKVCTAGGHHRNAVIREPLPDPQPCLAITLQHVATQRHGMGTVLAPR